MDISWLKAEYSLPEVDFLSIEQVFSLKGVRQQLAKNVKLPPPDLDLSKFMRKSECCTAHHYWMRGTIEVWLEKLTKKAVKTEGVTKAA